MAGTPHAARIRTALGPLLVTEFNGVAPHVPLDAVHTAVALATEHRVDLVLALGGGSAIGLGKAIVYDAASTLPLVAIPTTYAGSEMTPVLGTTDTSLGRKRTVRDPRVLPAVAIYDVDLTLDLPPAISASTGINALAHCVEAVYSRTTNPLIPPLALDAVGRIARALPRCVAEGKDRDARHEMLVAAFLAGFCLAHAGMALHHGLCHVLGGRLGIPHGVANGIMLPHVVRYNGDVAAAQLDGVRRAMGVDTEAAQGIADLVASVGLPQRLRDVGVAESDLAAVAEDAMHSPAVRANPKPISDSRQVLEVLRSAW
jgi:maleylacetate reductase